MAVLVSVMSVVAAISGICLGWSARGREKKKEIKAETKAETETTTSLKLDVEYIKRGVDDIRMELRAQGQKVDELTERVIRVEESTKQAHKRIDEMKG